MEAGSAGPLSQIVCPACQKSQTVPARVGDLVLQRRVGPIVAGELFGGLEESSGREVDVLVMESDQGPRAAMVNATVRLHKTLAKLEHPYIQHIHRFTASEEHPIIVVEPRATSVASLMGKRGIHPAQMMHLAIQSARAFRAAEGAGLCHMSLQPAHFQLRAEYTVRLMGFSFWNHIFSSQPEKGWASIGPIAYVAPEVAAGQRPDAKSDMYSFGACLVYFLTKEEPNEKMSARDILRAEQDLIPPDFSEILNILLKPKAADRPENWSEVVALLKGEGTAAGRKSVSLANTEPTDDQDLRERSSWSRPKQEDMQSGFLHGMASANVEFDADDVMGQLHGMADSSSLAALVSEQMANAKPDSPVDIMARAIMDGEMDGEMDDLTPADIGSGLTEISGGISDLDATGFDLENGFEMDDGFKNKKD